MRNYKGMAVINKTRIPFLGCDWANISKTSSFQLEVDYWVTDTSIVLGCRLMFL